jgi:glycosyltransferase involved in cell wall biosynthesis
MHRMPSAVPLKLAFLADSHSIHTARWLTFFAERGHAVTLLLPDDQRPSRPLANVTIQRYSGPGRLPILSVLQRRLALRDALQGLEPDILHAHFVASFGWQARLTGFHPCVVTAWGSDLLVSPMRSLRARVRIRLTLPSADLVTAPSRQLAEVAAQYGARRDRIRRIAFGVDTAEFSPGPPDHDLLARAGIPACRIVFSPRAIRPIYRQHLVVGAMGLLPADTVAIMPGRNADASTLGGLRDQARSLGVESKLIVIDEISPELMMALYRTASAVVSVPESDGLPSSVLEAMASGAPTLVGDLPGPREALGSELQELVLADDDPATLAAGIRRLLDMPGDERTRVAAALRHRAVESYDLETNMLAMEELYLQLRAAS